MPLRPADIAALLRRRFFSDVHLGLLAPGDRLPSARELAAELGADRRAVLAAYHALERDGLVELRQRSGIYFADNGTPAGAALSRRSAWVVDFLLRGFAEGLPAPDAPERLHQYLRTLRLRAACVECNDDQRDALCAELAADYGFEADGVDVDALVEATASPRGVAPLAARRADLLVTTPFHAGEVKEAAARLGKPWLAATLRSDLFGEIARRLPAGPVYFVVTDPRFATKLTHIFADAPGASHLIVLPADRGALAQVPERAPVYDTRPARARLERAAAGAPELAAVLARVPPEPRAFAAESARELLTFVVRANMEALAARDG